MAWCDDIEALIARTPTCWDAAWMAQMLQLVKVIGGCGGAPCTTPETVVVPNGTLTSEFIDVGWGGVRPSAAEHEILYVIRGCEVFLGVNNSECELESGFGWCPLCTGRVKQIAQLLKGTVVTLAQSTSYQPFPPSGEWTEEFNNGVSLAIGGQPRIDNALINVPAHCFQIDGGLHQIDIGVGFQRDFQGAYTGLDMRLYNVTDSTEERVWSQLVNDRGGADKWMSVIVNPVVATIYRVDYRTNPVGANFLKNTGSDQINIERIA